MTRTIDKHSATQRSLDFACKARCQKLGLDAKVKELAGGDIMEIIYSARENSCIAEVSVMNPTAGSSEYRIVDLMTGEPLWGKICDLNEVGKSCDMAKNADDLNKEFKRYK